MGTKWEQSGIKAGTRTHSCPTLQFSPQLCSCSSPAFGFLFPFLAHFGVLVFTLFPFLSHFWVLPTLFPFLPHFGVLAPTLFPRLPHFRVLVPTFFSFWFWVLTCSRRPLVGSFLPLCSHSCPAFRFLFPLCSHSGRFCLRLCSHSRPSFGRL